ncbi:MAG TPA: Flp pilus assembly protein CpaB [Bryobacteraceae bacterium]|nr:Flp pilus assembly protein CpaB [Bryobacteraceae bacterium]
MNRRLSTILLLAFIVAAVSSYLVYRVAGKQFHSPQQSVATKIVVAAHDLDLGSLISDGDLSTAEWVGVLPKGAVLKKESAIGRGVMSQLYQGEPIVESRLAAAGAGGGLAATIPPGMRASAVRVNEVVGLSGFVVPGMRVDVIISGIEPGGAAAQGPKVKTILQNIQVLSAGTNIQKDNEGKPVQVPVVNLLVTPEQAEVLSLASNETRIQLVLRNPLDMETTKTPGVGMASLFSGGAPPKVEKAVVRKPVALPPPPPVAEKAPEPRVLLVQIMNGSKRSEEKFKTAPDGVSDDMSKQEVVHK